MASIRLRLTTAARVAGLTAFGIRILSKWMGWAWFCRRNSFRPTPSLRVKVAVARVGCQYARRRFFSNKSKTLLGLARFERGDFA